MRTRLNPEPLEPRTLPAAAFESLPVLPFTDAAVLDHARAIVARGQQLGRRLDTFIRLGDSNSSVYGIGSTAVAPFLNPLGADSYNPSASGLAASNPQLLDTWWTYTTAVNATGQDSFSWIGPGASAGWGTAEVLAGLATDVAVANPGIALVMVGTNEIPRADDAGYRSRLTRIVSSLVAQGILPVLSTIPPYQFAGNTYQYRVARINQVIADVAAAARVPLWNFWRAAAGLPYQGIVQDRDLIHYNVSPNRGGSFGAFDLLFAQNRRNLQALKILDWFRETVANPAPTQVAPRANWQPLDAGRALYSVGRDAGFSPTVDVIDAGAGRIVNRFLAFGPSFGGGVRVATGDVNGDGFTDVVCATASGLGVVKVFSGKDGSVLARLAPFGEGFRGGLSVAVGDVTGDGVADVVAGQAAGASWVRVYAGGTFAPVSSFRAFSPNYTGGVRVAVADVARTGPVVAVGAAAGVPVVGLFDAGGSRVSSRQVYGGTGFGVTIAAADLDGDGSDELAVAPVRGDRTVRVLNPVTWRVRATFAARPVVDPAWGLRLGTVRSDGADTLLVGNGPGSRTVVLGFTGLGGKPDALKPDADRAFGIFVG